MESQPQNPEFRYNPKNFHPCDPNKTSNLFRIQVVIKRKVFNILLRDRACSIHICDEKICLWGAGHDSFSNHQYIFGYGTLLLVGQVEEKIYLAFV